VGDWSDCQDNRITLAGVTAGKLSLAVRSLNGRGETSDVLARTWEVKPNPWLSWGERLTLKADTEEGDQPAGTQPRSFPVESLAFSPDGKRLAFARAGEVRVLDMTTGRKRFSVKGSALLKFTGVAFSPDGKWVAAGGEGCDDRKKRPYGLVKLWDGSTGKEALTLKGPADRVTGVAFSPDGKWVAAGGEGRDDHRLQHDGWIKLWDGTTGKEVLTLKGHAGRVSGVAFGPGGDTLAAFGDGKVSLWQVPAGKVLGAFKLGGFKGHIWPLAESIGSRGYSVAASPDGELLASAARDGVRVWRMADGRLVRAMAGYEVGYDLGGLGTFCRVLAFTPDGKHLAAAGQWAAEAGYSVLVMRASDGIVLRTLNSHAPVSCVAFSPDGKQLGFSKGVWGKPAEICVWAATRPDHKP
jgi:WD40 repeat protein